MSKFEVLTDPKGRKWAYRAKGAAVETVQINEHGKVSFRTVAPVDLATHISSHLRMGYTAEKRPLYLHTKDQNGQLYGFFDNTHPELACPEGVEVTLIVLLPSQVDFESFGNQVTARLNKVPALGDKTQAFVQRAQNAQVYLTAFTDHPAFTLVLAQWAREQQQLLTATQGFPPKEQPSQSPSSWGEYLTHWFAPESIRLVQQQLGWSTIDLINKNLPAVALAAQPEQTSTLSQDNWLAQSRLVSF